MAVSHREQLAWASGFYDGEGSTSLTTEGYPRMCVGQLWSNVRALERFQKTIGLGSIYGPYDKATMLRPNNGPQGMLIIQGFEKVQAAVAMLWPFLDTEKREQATRVLTTCVRASASGKCKANLHHLAEVGRIDNRCAGCYKLKHPNSKAVAT